MKVYLSVEPDMGIHTEVYKIYTQKYTEVYKIYTQKYTKYPYRNHESFQWSNCFFIISLSKKCIHVTEAHVIYPYSTNLFLLSVTHRRN